MATDETKSKPRRFLHDPRKLDVPCKLDDPFAAFKHFCEPRPFELPAAHVLLRGLLRPGGGARKLAFKPPREALLEKARAAAGPGLARSFGWILDVSAVVPPAAEVATVRSAGVKEEDRGLCQWLVNFISFKCVLIIV
jgi:hypothetical protein